MIVQPLPGEIERLPQPLIGRLAHTCAREHHAIQTAVADSVLAERFARQPFYSIALMRATNMALGHG